MWFWIINIEKKIRLINIYRVFNPVNGMTQKEFFINQMRIVKHAIHTNLNQNIILTGDFNLDYGEINSIEYPLFNLSQILIQSLDSFNLTQLVHFLTWERLVMGNIKTSTLDHVYVKDFNLVSNLKSTKQIFGDHSLISFTISIGHQGPQQVIRRNWQCYSKEKLLSDMSTLVMPLLMSNHAGTHTRTTL